MKNSKFIPSIYRDDVILPLFTEELRNHLNKKLYEQKTMAHENMVKDGWGKTKFGEPNPEFYGDYTHRFWGVFGKYLTRDLEIIDPHGKNAVLYMRCTNVINNEFGLLPLNTYTDIIYAYTFFDGFKYVLFSKSI